MPYLGDIVTYDSNGQPVLIVQIKNKVGTDSSWAKRMRQNLLANNSLPNVRFFLLALPDRFYLWVNTVSKSDIEELTHEVDSMFFLKPYYEKSGASPGNLSNESFELMISSWFNEILHTDTLSDVPHQVREWLIESGLLDAIKKGHIASQLTV